jgi:hypothetical protein
VHGHHGRCLFADIFIHGVKEAAAAGAEAFEKGTDLKESERSLEKAKLDIRWGRIARGICERWKTGGQVLGQLDELGDLVLNQDPIGTTDRHLIYPALQIGDAPLWGSCLGQQTHRAAGQVNTQ